MMMKRLFIIISIIASQQILAQIPDSTSGYIIRHEVNLGKEMPGPHTGKGMTSGFVFFDDVKDFVLSFRKRVLHPGSSIGKHTQTEDEVYYIVSGSGTMYINDLAFGIKPGDAILTRKGSTHETIQRGKEDLVLIITYEKRTNRD